MSTVGTSSEEGSMPTLFQAWIRAAESTSFHDLVKKKNCFFANPQNTFLPNFSIAGLSEALVGTNVKVKISINFSCFSQSSLYHKQVLLLQYRQVSCVNMMQRITFLLHLHTNNFEIISSTDISRQELPLQF